MLISFMRDADKPKTRDPVRSEGFRALTNYMQAAVVTKRIDGKRCEISRDPVPEILCGAAPVFRGEVARLPFQRKFRFALLSFDHSDIDVRAFNAGDPSLRHAVDLTLHGVFEALWPGIPRRARPHAFATTHTHTGRLEVNIAFARAVFPDTIRARSLNPDPPTPYGEPSRYWQAFRDMLNHRFGWADPEDPARRQWITAPDWRTKEVAEALRADHSPKPLPYEPALDALREAATRGVVRSRADVEAFLNAALDQPGWSVLSTTDRSITIGPPEAPAKKRVRLGGLLMSAAFGEKADTSGITHAQALRARTLATAEARFEHLLATRAAYNRKTYGFSTREAPDARPAQWLEMTSARRLHYIPARHHLCALTERHTQDKELAQHDAVPNRPALSGPDAPHRNRPDPRNQLPARADRAAGSPDLRAADSYRRTGGQLGAASRALDELEQQARRLAGPVGWVAAITLRVQRLRRLMPTAARHLSSVQMRPLWQPAVIDKLTTLTHKLETLNDRADTFIRANPGPYDSDHPAVARNPIAGNAPRGRDPGRDRATTENGRDDGTPGPRAGSTGHASRSHREPVDAEPQAYGHDTEQRNNLVTGHRERSAGPRGSESPDRGIDVAAAQPGIDRPPFVQVLHCATGIARALPHGHDGKLTRVAGGFIYTDQVSLIAIYNDRVIYRTSDLNDDALCTLLRPVMVAAGYEAPPQAAPWRESDMIAMTPGGEGTDFSALHAADADADPQVDSDDPAPF